MISNTLTINIGGTALKKIPRLKGHLNNHTPNQDKAHPNKHKKNRLAPEDASRFFVQDQDE
ncbi:MAG TPA: hypothetical protein DEO64_01070 [Alcaligenes faecalis]|nr:hypothetical protein [Alcaligenes faecalis]